ncbi:MAG TPA: response regulator [Polyangiales bacterium]
MSESQSERTILVIDDDEQLRESYAQLLEGHGFLVAQAGDARAALDYCVNHVNPSLIVVDIHMPGMSGWEFLAVLKCYRRLASVPILIVSAYPLDNAAIAVYPSLTKPVEPAMLIATIEELLDVARPSFG